MSSSSESSSLRRVSCNDNPLLIGVELNEAGWENPSVDDRGDDSADDCGGGGEGILSRCCDDVRREDALGLEDKGGELDKNSDDEECCERRSPDEGKIGPSACCAGSIWVVAIVVVRRFELKGVYTSASECRMA